MMGEPEVAWRTNCALGEGPIWSVAEQALWFVDIKQGRVHRHVPGSGTGESFEVGGMPSFIVPAADGGWIVGSESALIRFDGSSFGEVLATIPQRAGNRTNDATVDEYGRCWFGTMDNAETSPTGTMWLYDQGQLRQAGGSAVVTNGPAVSPDGLCVYLVDSGARTVWRYWTMTDGTLRGRDQFLQLTEADGYPDGIICDAEGCLWLALWDGWGVRRYSPKGELLCHVPFPCARVTKLALGGPGLTSAFVTTARVGLSEAELADQPLAGSLFRFEVDVPGVPAQAVRL